MGSAGVGRTDDVASRRHPHVDIRLDIQLERARARGGDIAGAYEYIHVRRAEQSIGLENAVPQFSTVSKQQGAKHQHFASRNVLEAISKLGFVSGSFVSRTSFEKYELVKWYQMIKFLEKYTTLPPSSSFHLHHASMRPLKKPAVPDINISQLHDPSRLPRRHFFTNSPAQPAPSQSPRTSS